MELTIIYVVMEADVEDTLVKHAKNMIEVKASDLLIEGTCFFIIIVYELNFIL